MDDFHSKTNGLSECVLSKASTEIKDLELSRYACVHCLTVIFILFFHTNE